MGLADDPSPLRYRAYPWFPVLTVGTVLFLTFISAMDVELGLLGMVLIFSLPGLFVSAFLGVHGLFRDAIILEDASADWQPSWQWYIGSIGAITAVLTLITLFPPLPLSEEYALGPIDVVGTVFVSVALASGPVSLVYLLTRWRHLGLNYLK